MHMKTLWVCVLGVSLGVAGCGGGGGGNGDSDAGGDPIDSGNTGSDVSNPGTDGGTTTDAGIPRGPVLTQLVVGEKLSCAVLNDGTGKCWGDNREGRFGNGNKTSNKVPQPISGLTAIKQISIGYDHACAAMVDGTARCWGKNTNGSLGDNSATERLTPVPVMGLTDVKTIHAGMWTTCALTNAGNVFCWGRGGNLGDTTLTDSQIPKQVTTLSNVTQLSVAFNSGRSSNMHACGVRMNGTAFCWGANDVGQLGQNNQNPSRVPVDVMGITDALEITAGGGHACARRTSGLSCWGFGSSTGDGNNVQDLVPVPVMTTASNVAAIAAGNDHTLARTTGGGLLCWGRGANGQCMDSATFTPSGPQYLMPITATPTGITLFAAGGTHSCVYVPASSVTYCSGTNEYGEIGSGTPSSLFRTAVPTPVEW